jgi:diguanylate cyclase (GGDEF)-like protein
MTMKRCVLFTQVLIGLYLVAYIAILCLKLSFLADILSPLGAFISFGILFYAYKKVNKFKFSWLMASLACLFWGFSHILWILDELIISNAHDSYNLFAYLYILPNVFFALSFGAFFIIQWNKWSRVQLILDTLVTFLTALSLMWMLFFNYQFERFFKLSAESMPIFICIFCDVFTLSLVFIWCISRRRNSVPRIILVVILAIAIYTAADLYYTSQTFHNPYVSDSLMKELCMTALFILASTGLWISQIKNGSQIADQLAIPDNVGPNKRMFLLLTTPFIVIIFNGFRPNEVIFLVGIFIIYQILSGYVQSAIKTEYLLMQEKSINDLLEKRIDERTQELIAVNRDLDILSNQDFITGLYNRRYFLNELDCIIAEAGSNDQVVLFFMDIDQFKAINDSYGHDFGDEVLSELAARLNGWKPPKALLARLGGDEFVLVFKGQYQYEEIENTAKQINKLCSIPIIKNPYSFQLSLSIGITIYPTDAKERNAMMRNADIAMYHAKAQGYNKYSFFDSLLSDRVKRRNGLELLLKKVNFEQEFELHYQPQFSIPEGKLIGVEALLRWNSPEQGMIPPDEFIPIAEEIGRIVPIGGWVMMMAIRQISLWNNLYGMKLKMGINISPKQLDSLNFMNTLQSLIKTYEIKPEWLDAEITEGSAMKGEMATVTIFNAISATGASISLDDFGTGYSSLSYIKRFSINRLKIAKTLIDNISTNQSERQIVQAIIMMAKAMGIKTIAEGVELEDQLRILIELGCDEIQGFIYSRPLSAMVFEKSYLEGATGHIY